MIRAFLAAAALLAATTATADSALRSFRTMDDARGWEAVGRLEIAGKGFCTATLIAPGRVLTAAHCLYDVETGARIDADRMTFRAGLRDGRAAAIRSVRRTAVPEGYAYRGADRIADAALDLALLELDHPIRVAGIVPMDVAETLSTASDVGIVSYAQGREEAPSLQETCGVMGARGGVYVLSCDVDFGSSGAPVFQLSSDGRAHIVSIVSAKAMAEDRPVAIGAPTAPLAGLVLRLEGEAFRATAPGGVRVLQGGERGDIGARFVPAEEP